VEKASYSGNQNWQQVSFDVEAGTNTFTWKYQFFIKNNS
jgi:hypothetical protein